MKHLVFGGVGGAVGGWAITKKTSCTTKAEKKFMHSKAKAS